MNKKNIVLGVIGSDIHVVGNKIIDFALREAGYHVINLGIFTTQEDFLSTVKETDAAAVIVSSLYGHGELDCIGMKDKFVEAGLEGVKLYVGGNLVVGKQDPQQIIQKFRNMGFDRVGLPTNTPKNIIDWLKEDLG